MTLRNWEFSSNIKAGEMLGKYLHWKDSIKLDPVFPFYFASAVLEQLLYKPTNVRVKLDGPICEKGRYLAEYFPLPSEIEKAVGRPEPQHRTRYLYRSQSSKVAETRFEEMLPYVFSAIMESIKSINRILKKEIYQLHHCLSAVSQGLDTGGIGEARYVRYFRCLWYEAYYMWHSFFYHGRDAYVIDYDISRYGPPWSLSIKLDEFIHIFTNFGNQVEPSRQTKDIFGFFLWFLRHIVSDTALAIFYSSYITLSEDPEQSRGGIATVDGRPIKRFILPYFYVTSLGNGNFWLDKWYPVRLAEIIQMARSDRCTQPPSKEAILEMREAGFIREGMKPVNFTFRF